ncbi:MAG: NTP transferase domain-containing protein [Actinomycetota bacterium]
MTETLFDRASAGPERTPSWTAVERARPRTGVVLAAGRSERLADVTGGGSKALVRVGGLSLVERAVRGLLAEGIQRVIVVVGYQAGPVAAVVDHLAPGRVRAAFAENWELGNGSSLAAAEPFLAGEDLFVLVTTDHIFGEDALAALVSSPVPGVLVDHAPDPEAWGEGTRVRLHEEHVVEFSKELGDPAIDCGAFLLPPAVFDAQRRAAARGDGSLAGAVTELARVHPLAAVPLPRSAWWQDVDTPEDLRRVSKLLRRSLTKDGDGPVSRYVNRPVSTRVSMALAHLPIHPDVVSLVAWLVAVGAGVALGAGAAILGAVLVHLSSVLDGVDGEIARLQVRASPAGALLDGVLDRVADAAVIGGLAVWALDVTSSPERVVVLAIAATAGAMLSMASKDRIAALRIPPAPERMIGFLFGGRDARLLLVTVAAALGWPELALAVTAGTSLLSLVVRLVVTRSALRSWSAP